MSDGSLTAIIAAGSALAGVFLTGLFNYLTGAQARIFAAHQSWEEKLFEHRRAALADVLLKSEMCRNACFELCWAMKQGGPQDLKPLQKRYNEQQEALRQAVLSQLLFLPDAVTSAHSARVNRQAANKDPDHDAFWAEQLAAENDGNREIVKLAREAIKPNHLPPSKRPRSSWWPQRRKS